MKEDLINQVKTLFKQKMVLLQRNTITFFCCIFGLSMNYSESIVTIGQLPGNDTILIEIARTVSNVNAAKAQCASHCAILIPFDQGALKVIILQIFLQRKGKHIKKSVLLPTV